MKELNKGVSRCSCVDKSVV